MNTYIGTKTIQAKPMTRGEHSKSKGFDKVLDGTPEDEGYQVIYADGYESWSPKGVFEESYRLADTYADRLLIEVQDEADKLNKLNTFMAGPDFSGLPVEDKDLMYEQQRTMSRFVQILGKRLGRAKVKFEHKK